MRNIAQHITHSKAATIVAALLCLGMWLSSSIGSNIEEGHTALTFLHLLLFTLAALQLIEANSKLSIEGQKGSFPLTLFFMCCAITPQPEVWTPCATLLLMTTAICIILNTYRNPKAMGHYFAAFALISAGSLYAPQLVYLMPILLLCCGFMQSLHLRSALASMLGMIFPYWTSFCILFLTDNTPRINLFIERLTLNCTHDLASLTLPLGEGNTFILPAIAVQTIWTLLLVIPASTNLLFTANSKMQARASQLFQIAITTTLITASLVLPSLYKLLQPIIALLAAAIGATLFTGTISRGKNIWLIILLLLWGLVASLSYGTLS